MADCVQMDQKGCWEMQLCVGTGLLTEDCDNDDENWAVDRGL